MKFDKEKIVFLENNIHGISFDELTVRFNEAFGTDAPKSKIVSACKRHGLKSGTSGKNASHGHKWTEEETRYLADIYPKMLRKEVVSDFNDHFRCNLSFNQVIGKAQRIGLKNGKSKEQFMINCAGWNKGKKMPYNERTASTQFKRGNVPHNTARIGEERVKSGYLQRKIGEPNIWKPVHRIVWEENFGKIPNDCIVGFLNGDTMDVRPKNLYLVDRKVNIEQVRSKLHSSDPDITRAGIYLSKLNIAIREAERNNERY